ncbi:LysR family transcriptional regulator [Tateyamaria sp. ANG-S1]|uniref:helix-turn-helix domain-containing protein n=1 Tax=Tateyamaria sp. ANG-S1 TaxID=1577905 RepID=UPI0005802B7E|nr:LysR family transcriptional regulator [Tateyamaria sp. ANG-S1]KIC51812.1 hypothetical protein RA29_00430 [Tateyamaria sp. ANG-S1]
MKNVNLNALRVFSVVASYGNLQRPAEELNLSRGAVSQRIKQLEIELGLVLLVRGRAAYLSRRTVSAAIQQ